MTTHPIGIENNDHFLSHMSLIIAHDIQQSASGSVNAGLGDLIQLFPCKNDIISIDQKIFLSNRNLLVSGVCLLIGFACFLHPVFFVCIDHTLLCARQSPLDLPKFTDKDLFQIRLQSAVTVIALGLSLPHGFRPRLGCRNDLIHARFLLFLIQIGRHRHMHLVLDLIPRHQIACPVTTKYRITGIAQILIRVIGNLCYHLILIVARKIAFQSKCHLP